MISNRKFYTTFLVALLLLISLGYAYFHSDLSINGDALFKRATWNIHFVSPPTVTTGSVSGASVTQAATVTGTNNDTVTYSITLNNPKDYYEFTVNVKNDGTMDGMISTFSNKVYSGNTEITLPDYLKSEVTYANGAKVKQNQILRANGTETFKVKVYYRDDVSNNQLPGSDVNLTFRFKVVYVQADSTAIDIVAPGFNAQNSWEDIIDYYNAGNLTQLQEAMEEGTTKAVPLDLNLDGESDATCNARIVNLSTPAECSNAGFSQTACGLVLECANIITSYGINSTDTNVGGWPASSIRTYLNDETANVQSVYNALPSDLRSKIIPTTVVSGHGTDDLNNFTSTDKLYLLSSAEVWIDEDNDPNSGINYYDSAYNNTRQLDYYANLNTTTNSYAGVIKKINNTDSNWWLRSARFNNNISFISAMSTGGWTFGTAIVTSGVSPAFRIA